VLYNVLAKDALFRKREQSGENMKLTLIGGGGVRAPLFVASALRRTQRLGIEELCLMDVDAEKLQIISGLCRAIACISGSLTRITSTTDARAALEEAHYVVTTVRVGAEGGRVLDERIALRHGVLGQETTGPGGFAMAMRSIPVILGYAELLEQVSPGAWIFNFTNPAGLVTQALRDRGFNRVVGICDGANEAQHAVARWLGVDAHRLQAQVFGLNHLSWTSHVLLDGQDVLGPLLRNPAFLSDTRLNIFDPELVERLGMWLNEYLFYYYYAERAFTRINAEDKTRGEEIVELNRRLLDQLCAIDVERDPQAAIAVYYAYEKRRGATYMHYARPDAPTPQEADQHTQAADTVTEAVGEGYAGVALDVIEGLQADEPVHTALNVPNAGAITCMRPGDVVEVHCRVDRQGVHSLSVGEVPEPQEMLMRAVKLYERLAVEASRDRSRATAVDALMAHPLVLSYSRAKALVDEYLAAHARYVGTWK
jgi:6-phospho-beta-glucosidase